MISNTELLDVINASIWSLTYLIGLIYLFITRKALISPWFSLIVVPWELVFFIQDIPRWFSDIRVGWGEQGRLMFIIIHFPIIFLLFFRSIELKKKHFLYFNLFVLLSALYLISFKVNWNMRFVLGFMITIVGVLLWVISLLLNHIPINKLQILTAFLPTVADFLAILFYGPETRLGLVLSVTLFLVHVVHLITAIVLYIKKRRI